MPKSDSRIASMICWRPSAEDMFGDLPQALQDQQHSGRAHPAGAGASRPGAAAPGAARSDPLRLSQQSADANAGAAGTGAARAGGGTTARTTVQQRPRTAAAR